VDRTTAVSCWLLNPPKSQGHFWATSRRVQVDEVPIQEVFFPVPWVFSSASIVTIRQTYLPSRADLRDSPDRKAHYNSLGLSEGVSFLTWNLPGYGGSVHLSSFACLFVVHLTLLFRLRGAEQCRQIVVVNTEATGRNPLDRTPPHSTLAVPVCRITDLSAHCPLSIALWPPSFHHPFPCTPFTSMSVPSSLGWLTWAREELQGNLTVAESEKFRAPSSQPSMGPHGPQYNLSTASAFAWRD
jgi:hypothetical protein